MSGASPIRCLRLRDNAMTILIRRSRFPIVIGVIAALSAGCAVSFKPVPLDTLPYLERAETLEKNGVRVTAAVLTRDETRRAFGKQLDKKSMQPVWIQIENNSDRDYWFMRHGLDPDYLSAFEAAYVIHGGNAANMEEIDDYFLGLRIDPFAPPGASTSGFVFTNLKQGTKEVRVRLLGDKELLEFEFYITVPGLRADWQRVDFQSLYAKEDIIDFDDPIAFREALEAFPCCTTKKNGSGSGDPMNLVVIASKDELQAFIKAGWDETEIITTGSSWRTFKSFVSGGEYKNSPISALYVYGRAQDISLQKARETIHERNHLRLWLSPMRWRSQPVWMGAISRDIGVFWTTRTWNLTTHAIDPAVDEARNYLTEDLATAESLAEFSLIDGVGEVTQENPKQNLLGSPWWTNGRRVILLLSTEPVPLDEIEMFGLEQIMGSDPN